MPTQQIRSDEFLSFGTKSKAQDARGRLGDANHRLSTGLSVHTSKFADGSATWSPSMRSRDLSPELAALETEIQSLDETTDRSELSPDDYEARHSTDGSDGSISLTPQLTEDSSLPSSRSASLDSFNQYLPNLYSDQTPHASSSSLASPNLSYPNSSASSPYTARSSLPAHWREVDHYTDQQSMPNDLSQRLEESLSISSNSEQLVQTATATEGEPRMLSLPLQISNPPPLPIEHAIEPKTYLPRHRSSASLSNALSPKGSSVNLSSLAPLTAVPKPPRKVCFDRVVVITSPHESEYESEEEESC